MGLKEEWPRFRKPTQLEEAFARMKRLDDKESFDGEEWGVRNRRIEGYVKAWNNWKKRAKPVGPAGYKTLREISVDSGENYRGLRKFASCYNQIVGRVVVRVGGVRFYPTVLVLRLYLMRPRVGERREDRVSIMGLAVDAYLAKRAKSTSSRKNPPNS